MKSRAVGAESSSKNALGHESLSREATRHADIGLALGVVTCTATNAPGFTPDTATPKYPAASVVVETPPPAAAPPTSVPRKHAGAEDACSVIGWFAAPSTRPTRYAF